VFAHARQGRRRGGASSIVTLIIRPATQADAGAISAVHIGARAQAYADLMPPEELAVLAMGVTPRMWAARLTHGWALVAVEDGIVVGFVYVGPNHEGLSGVGDLEALHIDPAHQGMGIGGRLHDAGLEILARHGFSTFVLWVIEGNERAIRFYRRRGWEHDGQRVHEIGGVFLRFVKQSATNSGEAA
jgi:ribosomal protein S18 acetylase RimI-like enzyme